jgi:hypothetical protein
VQHRHGRRVARAVLGQIVDGHDARVARDDEDERADF